LKLGNNTFYSFEYERVIFFKPLFFVSIGLNPFEVYGFSIHHLPLTSFALKFDICAGSKSRENYSHGLP